MNSSGSGLYITHTLYWCIHRLPTAYGLQWHGLLVQNNSHGTLPTYARSWGLLSLYCCTIAQCKIGSCWQKLWVGALHCPIFHCVHDLGFPLPTVMQCPGLVLMCLFPGTMASCNGSSPCTWLLSIVILLFHIFLEMIYSITKHHWLILASYMVCTPLQSLVRTY